MRVIRAALSGCCATLPGGVVLLVTTNQAATPTTSPAYAPGFLFGGAGTRSTCPPADKRKARVSNVTFAAAAPATPAAAPALMGRYPRGIHETQNFPKCCNSLCNSKTALLALGVSKVFPRKPPFWTGYQRAGYQGGLPREPWLSDWYARPRYASWYARNPAFAGAGGQC